MQKILVVATHPDDETLGAGGLILKKKKEGCKVYVLNMTDMSRECGFTQEQINIRTMEIDKMTRRYSLDGYYNLKLKPAMLDTYSYDELVKKVSDVFREVKPDTVILPYMYDIHSDHRIVFEVCYSCTKSFRYHFVKKVLMMETPSETDFALPQQTFSPNYFVNISEYINEKVEIAEIFKSEIREHPFPRSKRNIRAYGTIRGAVIGVDSAEAFFLLKEID